MAEGVLGPSGLEPNPLILEKQEGSLSLRVSQVAREALRQSGVPQEQVATLDARRITLGDPAESSAEDTTVRELVEELIPDEAHLLTPTERAALATATKSYLGPLLPPDSQTLRLFDRAITIMKVSVSPEESGWRQDEAGRPLSRCVILSAPPSGEGESSAPLHIIDLWVDPSSPKAVQGFTLHRGGRLFDEGCLSTDEVLNSLSSNHPRREATQAWSVQIPTDSSLIEACAEASFPLRSLLKKVTADAVEVIALPEHSVPGGTCYPLVVQGTTGEAGGHKVPLQGVELNLVLRPKVGWALEKSQKTITLSTQKESESSVLEQEAALAVELATQGVALPPHYAGRVCGKQAASTSTIAILPRAAGDASVARRHFSVVGLHHLGQQMLSKLDAMHQGGRLEHAEEGRDELSEYLQPTRPMIHGDIKLQNFVVSCGWHEGKKAFPAATYLIDFGTATALEEWNPLVDKLKDSIPRILSIINDDVRDNINIWREFESDLLMLESRMLGTPGFIAPEWAQCLKGLQDTLRLMSLIVTSQDRRELKNVLVSLPKQLEKVANGIAADAWSAGVSILDLLDPDKVSAVRGRRGSAAQMAERWAQCAKEIVDEETNGLRKAYLRDMTAAALLLLKPNPEERGSLQDAIQRMERVNRSIPVLAAAALEKLQAPPRMSKGAFFLAIVSLCLASCTLLGIVLWLLPVRSWRLSPLEWSAEQLRVLRPELSPLQAKGSVLYGFLKKLETELSLPPLSRDERRRLVRDLLGL